MQTHARTLVTEERLKCSRLYCIWCAEIIEEVKLASLSLGEESKTKKKEKGKFRLASLGTDWTGSSSVI